MMNFMKDVEQTKPIQKLIDSYALALNSADVKSIPAFFTEDGTFMPQDHKTLTRSDLLRIGSNNHLMKSGFHIKYDIENILLEDQLAFVTAKAITSQKDKSSNAHIRKSSRDFFVLKPANDQWKILVYIFNDVKVI